MGTLGFRLKFEQTDAFVRARRLIAIMIACAMTSLAVGCSGSGSQTQSASASADAGQNSVSAASENGPTSSAASLVNPIDNIVVSDVKMETEEAEGMFLAHFVTLKGSVSNKGDQAADMVTLRLNAHEMKEDKYGDPVPDETSKTLELTGSMTPGVIGDTVYDLKAGETREFEFRFVVEGDWSEPDLQVANVSELPANQQFIPAEQFNPKTEVINGTTHLCLTNNTGKLITSITASFGYDGFLSNGKTPAWIENEVTAEHVRPGAVMAFPEDAVMLGALVQIDDGPAPTPFEDEFSIELVRESDQLMLKVTNETGEYIEGGTIYLSAIGKRSLLRAYDSSDDSKSIVARTASIKPMKPGEEQEIQVNGGAYKLDPEDLTVIDVIYTVDEEKSTQKKS